MEKLISETYYILQNLRKLQNDVGHEVDLDHHNLRMGMRHLNAFYNELIQAALEKQQKDREDRNREEQSKDTAAQKRRKKEAEESIRAALDIMKG